MSIISSFPASPVSQLIKEGSLPQPSLPCSRQIFTAPVWLVTQGWEFVFYSVFSNCSTLPGMGMGGWILGSFTEVFEMWLPPAQGTGVFTMNWRAGFGWSIARALVCTQIQERSKWRLFLWVVRFFFPHSRLFYVNSGRSFLPTSFFYGIWVDRWVISIVAQWCLYLASVSCVVSGSAFM